MGHRNLVVMVPCLTGLSFKTSPCKHLEAFIVFEHILYWLLRWCSNGLIPGPMLVAVAWLYKKSNQINQFLQFVSFPRVRLSKQSRALGGTFLARRRAFHDGC